MHFWKLNCKCEKISQNGFCYQTHTISIVTSIKHFISSVEENGCSSWCWHFSLWFLPHAMRLWLRTASHRFCLYSIPAVCDVFKWLMQIEWQRRYWDIVSRTSLKTSKWLDLHLISKLIDLFLPLSSKAFVSYSSWKLVLHIKKTLITEVFPNSFILKALFLCLLGLKVPIMLKPIKFHSRDYT